MRAEQVASMGQHWRLTGIGALALILVGWMWTPSKTFPPKAVQPWKTGLWVWAGAAPVASETKPDILYVQVQGTRWPEAVPPAEEYFVVKRLEPAAVPTESTALAIAETYKGILQSAALPVPIIGLQIDYDCPTGKLAEYAAFLRHLRSALPSEARLSITALLDWFTPGTSIREALEPVDEFVPQFYDAGQGHSASEIAEPLDASKWAPVFNALRVPYRIGVSSFGRIARTRSKKVAYFRDATPLDFAIRRNLLRSTETTAAGELVVQYRLPQGESGDEIDITFPTTASVRKAFEAAQRFGGYCAGVLFFRWPNEGESLQLTADDVEAILSGKESSVRPTVETRDGNCPDRHCTDVYLRLGWDPNPQSQVVRVRPLQPLALFLSDGPLKPFVNRQNQIFVSVPAYAGLRSVYLGRSLSDHPVNFEVSTP
jgi:hypothetical protein